MPRILRILYVFRVKDCQVSPPPGPNESATAAGPGGVMCLGLSKVPPCSLHCSILSTDYVGTPKHSNLRFQGSIRFGSLRLAEGGTSTSY